MSQDGSIADLRIRRTRKSLREALVDLATEKGFEAVTVQDLADRAMVNRATFYRHYQDKYALALDYATELLTELDILTHPLVLDHLLKPDSPAPDLIRLFEHASNHAKFYRIMLGKQATPFFAAQLQGHIERVMRAQLTATSYDERQTRVPLDLCVHFLATNALATLVWWLDRGQPYTVQQMAIWLPQLTWHGLGYGLGFDLQSAPGIAFAKRT
jgi:AcrR family transcriptional regulator